MKFEVGKEYVVPASDAMFDETYYFIVDSVNGNHITFIWWREENDKKVQYTNTAESLIRQKARPFTKLDNALK